MDNFKDVLKVYSSQAGRLCPNCEKPVDDCICSTKKAKEILGDGKVRVERSNKGRRGKMVTLVSGLPLTASELATLAKKLKKKCGAGGTVKDGIIEIQGDRRDFLITELKSMGYEAKPKGG